MSTLTGRHKKRQRRKSLKCPYFAKHEPHLHEKVYQEFFHFWKGLIFWHMEWELVGERSAREFHCMSLNTLIVWKLTYKTLPPEYSWYGNRKPHHANSVGYVYKIRYRRKIGEIFCLPFSYVHWRTHLFYSIWCCNLASITIVLIKQHSSLGCKHSNNWFFQALCQ